MNAYDQGYKAYCNEEDLEDNPYPEWEQDFEEWDDGFLNAAGKEE